MPQPVQITALRQEEQRGLVMAERGRDLKQRDCKMANEVIGQDVAPSQENES